MTRIALTGTGVTTPLGEDPAVLAGRVLSGARTGYPRVDVPGILSGESSVAGQITAPDPEEFLLDRKSLKYMDNLSRPAVRAAGLALRSSGLVLADQDPYRVGVYMGIGFVASELKDLRPIILSGRGPDGRFDPALMGHGCRINPISVFRSLPNIPACNVSIGLGIKGENSVLYPDAPQAALALAEAVDALKERRCDVALAGGASQAVSFLTLITLKMIGDYESDRRAPPADGAAVLVLETEERARTRGARILAFVEAPETASDPGVPYSGPRNSATLARILRRLRPEEGGFFLSGGDGSVELEDLARDALRSAVGDDVTDWITVHTRPGLGHMHAADFPIDVALAAVLMEHHDRDSAVIAALGSGGQVAACRIRKDSP